MKFGSLIGSSGTLHELTPVVIDLQFHQHPEHHSRRDQRALCKCTNRHRNINPRFKARRPRETWRSNKPGRRRDKSIDPSLFEPAESEITPGSTLSKARGITPRSSKFAKLVLHPRRIFLNDTNSIVPSGFSHFSTEKPLEGYKTLDGLGGANIRVTMDDASVKCVAAEYKKMRGLRLRGRVCDLRKGEVSSARVEIARGVSRPTVVCGAQAPARLPSEGERALAYSTPPRRQRGRRG